jgi:dienelactone hydrolase
MLLFAFAAVAALASMPADAGSCGPRREAVVVALPGFVSPGEIVRPPAAVSLRGLLVLFPGSDVADMDGAIVGAGDRIVSRPLRQVADRMACAGFASLRYNKRHVTGATTVDREKFDMLTGADLAADGRAALAFARSQPGLKELPVGLVGWSEGTTVAMAVASAEPVVSAVVLMAPVVDSQARVAQAQYGRIGKPYLENYATNGSLDAEAIARADAGPGGVLAHIFVRMFRGFRPGERINPLLDTNKDGRISFSEADPIIASWYADGPDSGLGMSATGRALPGIAAALTPKTPSLLILQGLNDSMISPEAAQRLAAQPDMRGRIDLRTYNGLGHALGPAASAEQDGLLPVAQQPLNDMAEWLAGVLPQ